LTVSRPVVELIVNAPALLIAPLTVVVPPVFVTFVVPVPVSLVPVIDNAELLSVKERLPLVEFVPL
jgi:hypothetical protein